MRRKWRWSDIWKGFAFLATICLLVYTIIHPRIQNIGVFLMVIYFEIRIYHDIRKKKEKKGIVDIVGYAVMIPIVLGITYFFCSFWGFAFAQRMPWEYKGDIKELKAYSWDWYYYFPDEIPKGATSVKWVMCPGMMQGTPFEYLEFYTDKEYIQEVVSQYAEEAELIKYDTEYQGWPVCFSGERSIEEGRDEFIELYILYLDNGHHYRIRGFYVDEEKGLIRYFRE